LKQVTAISPADLVERRFERVMAYGRYKELPIH
jgi:hypothetical protein